MRTHSILLAALCAASVLAQSSTAAAATTLETRTAAAAPSASKAVDNLPALTTAAPAASSASKKVAQAVTGLPSLTPADGNDYALPTVTPPPAKGALFMQPYTLPEGTVFICVGAGLALCGLVVLAWRGLVAWSLHRSVRRATQQPPGILDAKPLTHMGGGGGGGGGGAKTGGGGFYAAGPGSTLSLDQLAASNRSPGANNSSLFFSPTSAPAPAPLDRRASAYLPAGFYVAGNRKSQGPPSNSSQTHFARAPRAPGASPPGTPLMAPASRGAPGSAGTVRASDSQTSLNVAPTGRAPSAYLEDLFESHGVLESGQGRY